MSISGALKPGRLGIFLRWGSTGILRQLGRQMRTGIDAATVDRLFESAHVDDLRWIVSGALLSLIVCAVLLFFYIPESAQFWAILKDTLSHLNAVTNVDGAKSIGSLTWNILHAFLKLLYALVLVLSPFVAVVGCIFAWVYRTGSTRLGIVDLFACEISTLCRVATVIDTVGRNVAKFDRAISDDLMPVATPDGKAMAAPPVRFVSRENYFPVFEGNTRDLQSLEARVVINITAFYTYMKTVRDMMRAMAEIPLDRAAAGSDEATPSGRWRDALRDLIYMLFLGLESARNAVEDLVEFQPERAERTIVILISELRAYAFLLREFGKKRDSRGRRLLLRWEDYERLMTECRRVRDKLTQANDEYQNMRKHRKPSDPILLEARKQCQVWAAADKLLPELKDCFDLARRSEAEARLLGDLVSVRDISDRDDMIEHLSLVAVAMTVEESNSGV